LPRRISELRALLHRLGLPVGKIVNIAFLPRKMAEITLPARLRPVVVAALAMHNIEERRGYNPLDPSTWPVSPGQNAQQRAINAFSARRRRLIESSGSPRLGRAIEKAYGHVVGRAKGAAHPTHG
jgi:hypothetical protein